MRKLKFVFGSHCHQPVGNFDFVFEKALREAYEPFFKELSGFPGIKMSAHISGPLIEWIEIYDGQFIDTIATLVDRGQLEMISGGFYEPVLASIPEGDRIGQIEMMNDYLQKRFETQATGIWMTERVWEPQVVGSLIDSGINYIVIDDFHLKSGGVREEEIDGYYITEDGGRPLAIFPISEALRYTIPFADPQETISYLRRAYDAGKSVVVMMDDGEKFGLWPGTHKLCYEDKWLNRFFTALMENSDWLELTTPQEVMKSQHPTGVVYLPTASYFEMSEWTLPAEVAAEFGAIVHELRDSGQLERFRPFLRGGIWRNFFSKYPEANNMHKRMLALSARIARLENNSSISDSEQMELAKRELYRSQCNCAYWHGVFGGLYMPHLRDAVYRHMLRAEKAADILEYPQGNLPTATMNEDINLDGVPEVVLRSEELNVICAPRYGGAIYELDYRPDDFNLLNTLASRPEAYHQTFGSAITTPAESGDTPSIHDIAREMDEELREALNYDWHNRYSLLDHCLHPDTGTAQMLNRSFRELGDFVSQPYEAGVEGDTVTLSRNGHLFTDHGIIALSVEKHLELQGNLLKISYCLANNGDAEADFVFGPEFNFSMLSGVDERLRYIAPEKGVVVPRMDSTGEVESCSLFGIEDLSRNLRITIALDTLGAFWYLTVQTISQSESGFELNYQSSAVLPTWRLQLEPGSEARFNIELAIQHL